METQYYGDYIMETILWRPNTVSIIETKLWRPNFGYLILWKLYYRNLIMETIYIVETQYCGDLIQRPYVIKYIDSILSNI